MLNDINMLMNLFVFHHKLMSNTLQIISCEQPFSQNEQFLDAENMKNFDCLYRALYFNKEYYFDE